MVTIQTYECPVHGVGEYPIIGEVEDRIRCMRCMLRPIGYDATTENDLCDEWAEWRPSAPAVRTQETTRRALTGHVRDTNPW